MYDGWLVYEQHFFYSLLLDVANGYKRVVFARIVGEVCFFFGELVPCEGDQPLISNLV